MVSRAWEDVGVGGGRFARRVNDEIVDNLGGVPGGGDLHPVIPCVPPLDTKSRFTLTFHTTGVFAAGDLGFHWHSKKGIPISQN